MTSLAVTAILGFSGCNLLEKIIKIPVKINSELTIPAGTGIGLITDVFAEETETNIEETLALEDSRKELIKTCRLKECVLTITSPSGTDFSFLNDIYVYLVDDELGEIQIASRTDIPNDIGGELELAISSAELSDYLKKDSVTIKTRIVTDEILLTNVTVNVYTRFQVTADIF